MTRYDILICGIGGQGAISLGTVLKLAAIRDGLGVAGAERRGGAQREGVVTSNVRYFEGRGESVSGLIPAAGARMMIAMEPLEALRQALYLNEGSVVVVNDFPLAPVHVRIGQYEYPSRETIYARLQEFTPHLYAFNIDEMSLNHFGSLRQVNTISLGMAFALGNMPVSRDSLLGVIRDRFPDFEANRKAFELGIEAAGKAPPL